MRTAQQLFDTMVDGLRKQNAYSVSDDGASCLYRGCNGRKCAIGQLIPDVIYRPAMEGNNLSSLLHQELLPADLQAEFNAHYKLLSVMQSIHDRVSISKWEEAFETTADKYDLQYTPPRNNPNV